MRRASVGALGLLALTVAGCKTESAKRKEVQECAAITLTEQAAATCLEVHYGWKKPAAVTAAQAFQRQRDSIAQVQADFTWRADAAKHRRELEQCRQDQSRSLLRARLVLAALLQLAPVLRGVRAPGEVGLHLGDGVPLTLERLRGGDRCGLLPSVVHLEARGRGLLREGDGRALLHFLPLRRLRLAPRDREGE